MRDTTKICATILVAVALAGCESRPMTPRPMRSYVDLGAMRAGSNATLAILLSQKCSKQFSLKAERVEIAHRLEGLTKQRYVEFDMMKQGHIDSIAKNGCQHYIDRLQNGSFEFSINTLANFVNY